MSNQAFAKQLRARQVRLNTKANKLQQKEEILGETDYDEDEFEKVISARHAAEWQSMVLTGVIHDIERGETFR